MATASHAPQTASPVSIRQHARTVDSGTTPPIQWPLPVVHALRLAAFHAIRLAIVYSVLRIGTMILRLAIVLRVHFPVINVIMGLCVLTVCLGTS